MREFLCLDDPPGPFDSLEESRVRVHLHVEVCVLVCHMCVFVPLVMSLQGPLKWGLVIYAAALFNSPDFVHSKYSYSVVYHLVKLLTISN